MRKQIAQTIISAIIAGLALALVTYLFVGMLLHLIRLAQAGGSGGAYRNLENFVMIAGVGPFTTAATIGALVAAGIRPKALIASIAYGTAVTSMIAVPATVVWLEAASARTLSCTLSMTVVYGNIALFIGMFLALFFRQELRHLLRQRYGWNISPIPSQTSDS
jgi:hypothetical protein